MRGWQVTGALALYFSWVLFPKAELGELLQRASLLGARTLVGAPGLTTRQRTGVLEKRRRAKIEVWKFKRPANTPRPPSKSTKRNEEEGKGQILFFVWLEAIALRNKERRGIDKHLK